MTRHVAPSRKTISSLPDLTFVILAASEGRRLRSYGVRSLVRIDGKALIDWQIEAIRQKFAGDIIVVAGFESERLIRHLPTDIRVVENENYADTNVGKSIYMGLNAAKSNNIFFIHGDVLFDSHLFANFNTVKSSIAVDYHNRIDQEKFGVATHYSSVTNLAFGIQPFFGQVVFVSGNELDILRKILSSPLSRGSLTTAELLAKTIDKGGEFSKVEIPDHAKLLELNTSKIIDEIGGKKN